MMVDSLTEFVQIVGMCDCEEIDLSQGNFTEVAVPETITIPEQKPDIEQVLKVMIDGKVTNLELVKTPIGEAASGLEKTGDVLVVDGKLHQKVVYVAETEEGDQPVHSAEFEIPFSTFVVVNTCLESGAEEEIDVEICIEDVYVEMLNPREIFKNVTLLVNVIVPQTPPEVNILRPEDGAVITEDIIEIEIEASDCECLDRVELRIDGGDENGIEEVEFAAGAAELSFVFVWDNPGDGEEHTIEAEAVDCTGNSVSQEITVTTNAGE